MIEDGHGNVLVQYREAKDWPGYTFPGGHVEAKETLEESVIREIKEETGLILHKVKLCGVMEWPWENQERYLAFLYKSRDFSGTLHSSEEGKVIWVKKEELVHLPLSQDMDKILRIYDAN